MGVAIATYTQHEKAEKHLPSRRAAEYATFFQTTPEYLLYGRTDALPERVPILDPFGADTGRSASLPPAPSEITRAMAPSQSDGIAHYGFVALYDEPQAISKATNIEGRLCVVSLDIDGVSQCLIRIVKNGGGPGRYHLIDNFGSMPLIDQKVMWASPVIALVPG